MEMVYPHGPKASLERLELSYSCLPCFVPGFFLAMHELCSYLLKDTFIELNHSKRISLRVPCRAVPLPFARRWSLSIGEDAKRKLSA